MVELASGCPNDLGHQAPSHSEPSKRRQDVQVPHPAHTLFGRIRIDVEPAHADQPPIDPGAQQHFAGPIELIRAARPLLDEAADELHARLFTLGEQGLEAVHRQVMQPFD
jgi:hypothetical protein